MKALHRFLIAVTAASAAGWAAAQPDTYPSKVIKLVIPFGVASGVDQLGREYAEVLRTQLNQTIVVENREGAGGIIGAGTVANAAPDGYTLMLTAHPPFAIATLLRKSPPYDIVSGFKPVAKVGAVPMVLVTSSGMPFKTWQEMTAYFKAHPEKANYAASGIGSPGQLFTQLIKLQTGLPLQEVSYKSTSQALTDVLGGQVEISLVSYPAALAHIKSGALRLLAVGTTKRLDGFPAVPTLAEVIGQPEFEASVWYGFLVPDGTPADRVERLHAEIVKASASSRVVDLMARSNITPSPQNPEQFSASIRKDVATSRKMIEAAKLALE